MPDLMLQIDGTLLAPPEASFWPKSSLFQWINFKWVQNFTIKGSGTVDGQGYNWWSSSKFYDIQKKSYSNYIQGMKPIIGEELGCIWFEEPEGTPKACADAVLLEKDGLVVMIED